jgi:hypothetical protein
MTVHPEVIFTAIYVIFLLAVAELLRRKGSHAQRQARLMSDENPSWAHWQAGHFRRGLSRVVLAIAVYILGVSLYRYHNIFELFVLMSIGIAVAWQGYRSFVSAKNSRKNCAAPDGSTLCGNDI